MVGVANTTDNVTTTSARKYALAQFSTATRMINLKLTLTTRDLMGEVIALPSLMLY